MTNILIVIAHPDDEAMFFIPTIMSLNNETTTLFLLCLSTGNFDGLGKTRIAELQQCAKYLEIKECECMNMKECQDGMENVWCEKTIARVVHGYVKQNDITTVIYMQYGYNMT